VAAARVHTHALCVADGEVSAAKSSVHVPKKQSTKHRAPHKTLELTEAEAAQRSRQRSICGGKCQRSQQGCETHSHSLSCQSIRVWSRCSQLGCTGQLLRCVKPCTTWGAMCRVRSWSLGGSHADARGSCRAASSANWWTRKRVLAMEQQQRWLVDAHRQLQVSLQMKAGRCGKWGRSG
jgi:hypothetical protein